MQITASRPGFKRRQVARWLAGGCAALLALFVLPATAFALPADPPSNYPERIAPVCNAAPQSVRCTQAGITELDAARAWEGESPYRLPSGFLGLSGAHQLVVLTNLDREADGLRTAPGTTAALNQEALLGARSGTDPVVTNPRLSWASNWAGGFPSAVWAYL